MSLGLLILAHKNAPQIARLIRALRARDRQFYLHIDARQPRVAAELRAALGPSPDVHLVEPAVSCRWGTYSLIHATLLGLRAMRAAGPLPERVLLLSGQDYPVASNAQIDALFAQHPETEFIEAFALDAPNRWTTHGGAYAALARIEQWHASVRGRWIHLPIRRDLPAGLRPYGGSQWWALTGPCLTDLLQTLDARPEIERFFQHAFIPDELFFQTLLMSSPWRERTDARQLHFVDFTRGFPTPPAIFNSSDFELITTAPHALLARKFDITRDDQILDHLDAWRLRAAVG